MPKIVWCGNKKWDDEYPEFPLPEEAREIKRSDNIFSASLPYGILPLLICFAIIYIKWHWLGPKTAYPVLVPIGIILGLFLMPVHELLHAICYCKGQTVYYWDIYRKVSCLFRLS